MQNIYTVPLVFLQYLGEKKDILFLPIITSLLKAYRKHFCSVVLWQSLTIITVPASKLCT